MLSSILQRTRGVFANSDTWSARLVDEFEKVESYPSRGVPRYGELVQHVETEFDVVAAEARWGRASAIDESARLGATPQENKSGRECAMSGSDWASTKAPKDAAIPARRAADLFGRGLEERIGLWFRVDSVGRVYGTVGGRDQVRSCE